VKISLPSILLLIVLVSYNPEASAQIGGDNTYEFLNLTSSPRIAAMGSNILSVKDNDINLALANPSLITPQMHNSLSLSFVDYYSDVNYGYALYSRSFREIGSFIAAMQFVDYGKFTYADETGEQQGNFSVSDYAFDIGWGRSLDSSFSIGANFKMIYSAYESYKSFGLGVDVAGTYHNSKNNFSISLIGKNIGSQLKAYRNNNTEPLPFEIQLALSKRLKHLPFRYSVVITHLERWDLTYDDPNDQSNIDPITNEEIPENKLESFADKLMRHIVIGGEFMPSKNFSVRFGYNYHRRQELKVNTKASTVGFSWGIGFRIKKFQFNYSRATYHLAGSPNFVSVTTNLSDFSK
jgi:hypothetical protein